MSHRIIVIDSQTPQSPAPANAITSESRPEFHVTVEYRPADSLTASQIGNEIARIQRRIDQIIEGGVD